MSDERFDPEAGARRVADWRRSRILLIGQAPGPTGPPPGRALVGGKTGTRMQFMTGCQTLKEYVKRFETTNLLDKYPGRARGKGDLFPMVEARMAALHKLGDLDGRTVVFVGLAVAEAFDWVAPVTPFEWRQCTGLALREKSYAEVRFKGAAVPHPSPVNAFWNDVENWRKARLFFDAALGRETCQQAQQQC